MSGHWKQVRSALEAGWPGWEPGSATCKLSDSGLGPQTLGGAGSSSGKGERWFPPPGPMLETCAEPV